MATNFYQGNYAASAYTNTTLNTALNSLAAAGYANSGIIAAGAISATPGYADIELVLSAAITLGASDTYLPIFLIPVPDGTNQPTYPGSASGAIPAQYQVASIPLVASATSWARGVTASPIWIPASACIIGIQNDTAAATFPASGNVINVWSFNEQAA